MSSSVSSYTFNNMGHLNADATDSTQRTVQNTKFCNYSLSNYFSDVASDSHVNFAVQQPTVMFSGSSNGPGLNGSVIDVDTMLSLNKEDERPLEKLQLFQRPFVTVPYLGRGSRDPSLESQLLQGQVISDKKSVNTIMDKSFMSYQMPVDDQMASYVNDGKSVEQLAMNGFERGGQTTRTMGDDPKKYRPNVGGV